ncbi:MAG: choice-of-anchor I family protein [Saprospiraceae bacterium]|nr:choice-of-anchor I family protein [Saprospiraceae bacterium]
MIFRITNFFSCVFVFLFFINSNAQQLVHYWNFNDNGSVSNLLSSTQSVVSGASITHISGGISAIDAAGGTGQSFDVENLDARNADVSGTHLRFNDPIGGELEFALPTRGFEDPIVKFSTRRSGSGAGLQYWSYTIDGINYIPFDTIAPNNGNPLLETLDFSSITEADNNSNFKIKVSFAQGVGGTVGNNRFDNFTLDARPKAVIALVHYWNFNDNTSLSNLLTPSQSVVTGASITHLTGGISAIDFAGGTGQNFNVDNFNARNGDVSGTHLRFNDPIGGELEFALPTTGYKDVLVMFSTRRSGSGAGLQYWSYSTDGVSYISFDTIAPNNGNPLLDTLDFTELSTANNNPNFKLKVSFDQGSGGTVGNNRFDNFTLDAYPIGGGDLIPPVAVFDPRDQTNNVAITAQPTITFNEPVRLVNNAPITNNNVGSLVELRLNNSLGAAVAFTATFANNSIIITPNNPLLNSQPYYVSLLPNVVEDFSDNAITEIDSAVFTCISLQTNFTPGDLVVVAYRMNATSTEDEVALLSLVDILPGTFINLTDSKYTTNVPPQCPNGIVWTAPENECITAGTVIKIQTSALIANKGTVTGSGFGLSSSGDQVIVYTGSAANPSYITALTSNAWVANNSSCSGSLSMIPNGLEDGINAVNLSTAPGNVSGNSVNAYYEGIQSGSPTELRTAILNPANWITAPGGTAAQTWPNYSFPAAPTVINASIINQTTIRLIFNTDLNMASSNTLSNYSGIPGLSSVNVTNNGTARDTVLLTYSAPFDVSVSYTLTVNGIINGLGVQMACDYQFSFVYDTKIGFASNFVVVNENIGTVSFNLNLTNPSASSVQLVVLGGTHSTADAGDFTLSSQTIQFTGSSNSIYTITIPIVDDTLKEQAAEYFVLALRNPTGCSIVGDPLATIYIKDNDRVARIPNKEIELSYKGNIDPSGSSNSTCEVVAYDPTSKRLFTTSAISGFLDIIDFSDPSALKLIKSIDINSYGGITSVAVRDGLVAFASPNDNEQLNGTVVFMDTAGTFLKQVTVGALPDMITFTPDGTKVLTANEGQPNSAYTVDPEGTISIIDLSGGIASLTQSNVTTLDFTFYNSIESYLIGTGIRKTKSTSTISQDFEPEFLTIATNSKTAWVTLQENNAMAEIDLQTNTIMHVWSLGTKDFSAVGNGFDACDNNAQILLANWPIKANFIPDAVANYKVAGTNYLVTANEGDEKEYAALTERTTVGAASYVLDPTVFPNAAHLKQSFNLGRMRVTNLNGDIDRDGDFDEIHCVGTRSFSIWDADNKTLVYDSGDDFELYTSTEPSISSLFNSDHENNSLKSRSRAKGPEPEGVTLARISGKTYAFVSLERLGGVMVYNVTDPLNVQFVEYKNSRNTASYGGDLGAETLVYIAPKESPDGKAYIVVANEISGTLAVYEVINNNTCVDTYSNITQQSCVSYTAPDGEIYTSSGTKFAIVQNANGCDSIITIQLTITSIDTSVTITSNAISSNQNGATYRWLDCNNGYAIIPSEAGQTFTPKAGGSFAVEVTRGTCSDTSACVLMTTGLNDFDADHHLVRVFPNPAKEFISIQSKSKMSSLTLYDLNGKILLEQKINGFQSTVNTKELCEGVYMIQVLNESKQIVNRSLQVIIR